MSLWNNTEADKEEEEVKRRIWKAGRNGRTNGMDKVKHTTISPTMGGI